MSISVNIQATSGAKPDGFDINNAYATLVNGNILLDNKSLIFTLTGSAIFTDTGTNKTKRITSVIGSANVSFTNIIAETVIVKVEYEENPLIVDAVDSTFLGDNQELDAPFIKEAINEHIDYSSIGTTISIGIHPWNGMQEGDIISLHVGEINNWDTTYKIKSEDTGKTLYFTIQDAREFLAPYIGHEIKLYYTLRDISSKTSSYSVIVALINNISIIGNRNSDRSVFNLVSINTITGKPVNVQWQYDASENFINGARFTDNYPLKKLHISIPGQHGRLELSPQNIASVGDKKGSIAYAITNNGKINYWGSDIKWAIPPIDVSNLFNLKGVFSSTNIVIAIDENDTLYSWGDNSVGGNLTAIVTNIETVACNRAAICAILHNGTLKAWGNAYSGGEIPNYISLQDGFKNIFSTRNAFCALNNKGNVVAWGEKNFGGDLPNDIEAINNVANVAATDGAFAIITTTGTVKVWGNSDYGGTLRYPISDAITIASSTKAFVVLHRDKSISAWGNSLLGGAIPNEISTLKNISAIFSNDGAFSVLTENGEVYSWGSDTHGGILPPEIKKEKILTLSSTSGAFSFINNQRGVGGWANKLLYSINNEYLFSASYSITRYTPPDAFLNLDNNGNLSTLGKSSTNAIPNSLYNMITYSSLTEIKD